MLDVGTNCGVYLIVSPSNGRYVGSSKSLKKRFNRYKNHSCARQTAIYSSLRKYGFENHKITILKNCEERELLFWERCFGDIYLSLADFPNGLNLVLPSYNDVPISMSKECREKVSINQKKRFESEEERIKTSISTKKGFTDEVRLKMSITHKIRCNTDKFKKERSESQKKYFSNKEAREKVSLSLKKYYEENPLQKENNYSTLVKYYQENPEMKGIYFKNLHKNNPNAGKEHGYKMKKMYEDNLSLRELVANKTREHLKKYGHPMSKKVINTETNEIYNTVKLASKSTIYCESTFREIIKDRKNITIPYKYV